MGGQLSSAMWLVGYLTSSRARGARGREIDRLCCPALGPCAFYGQRPHVDIMNLSRLSIYLLTAYDRSSNFSWACAMKSMLVPGRVAPSGAEGDRPGRGATFISEMRHGGHRFSTGGQVMLQGEAGWQAALVGWSQQIRIGSAVPYIALCALLWRPRARAPVGKWLDHDEHGCRCSKLECSFILAGGTMAKLAPRKGMLNGAAHNVSIICPTTAHERGKEHPERRDSRGPHRAETAQSLIAWADSGNRAIDMSE